MTAKGAYRDIKRFYRQYNSTQSGEYAVISDNLYLIKQRTAAVRSIRSSRTADITSKYLVRVGYSFEVKGFIEYCLSHGHTLTTHEVYAQSDVLCTLLAAAVARECNAFMKNGRGNASLMRNAVESLRRLPDLELDDIFAALCPAEGLLCGYEGFAHGDEATKDLYREAVVRYARRRHTDEYTALLHAGSICSDGRLLEVLAPFSPLPAVLYYLTSTVVTAAVTTAAVMLWGPLALAGALPVTECVFSLVDFLFARMIKVKAPPRLDPEYIPTEAQTLVVITTLLFGGKKDDELFERLEEFWQKSGRDNLKFGILGDFADSLHPHEKGDDDIAANAVNQIGRLNELYGSRFSLFLRSRTKNVADGIYGGRERKRGAVTELIAAINGGRLPDVCVCPFELKSIRYVLTLDGDTEMPIDGAEELLCAALHPENLPVVKNSRVVRGYGIFQPAMRTRLSETTRTYLSLFGSRSSGVYERACYDRYQTLLGSGVFCGKGLIDVALFSRLVAPTVPDGIILSHDVIEGGLMRCMLVSDTVFCDSTPSNSISHFRRQHRWVRGDVQNLVFLTSRGCTPSIAFRIGENLRRLLTPISAALGIILAAFFAIPQSEAALFLIFTSHLWLPSLLGMVGTALSKSYTPKRFFSRCASALAQSTIGTAYLLCGLAESAAVNGDAALRSLWRMLVSKKRLLSWTTFSQTNSAAAGRLLAFVTSHVSCVFAGTILAAFSPLIIYRLCGLLWLLFPAVAYLCSLPVRDQSPVITQSQRLKIADYAKEIFGFFADNVTARTHYLPPDNLQLSPAERTAYRTSPTNIGFYVVSLLAARDFGFIDSAQLYERASNVITTIESLEKSHGHLYNWYDIKTLRPIGGKYISAVDSGNLVTMLICAAAGLDEYAAENHALGELAARCRALAEAADFGILYNRKKKLLYLGCTSDGKPDGEGCYDMLMSEIRTTCYYLCASGRLPKRLWQSMSRTITADSGYIGMVSWAGSCFEYFMPELFLYRERDSFIDESLHFALSLQKRWKRQGVFGVSESGYFAFDPDMNYRYKVHGVPKLALKRYPQGEFVVSPYSSFLMMCDDTAGCLKNLDALAELGCHGKYGFYEALDLSEGESVVQSYMAHHLGMSLIACANVCFDGIFRRRFMRDKRLFACRELLAEEIPRDARLYIGESDRTLQLDRRRGDIRKSEGEEISLALPRASFITGGGLTLITTSSGHISMRCGSFAVNDSSFDLYNGLRNACFTFTEQGRRRPFTPLDGSTSFSYEYSGSHFAYTSSDRSFPASVIGTIYRDCRTFAFKTRCSGDRVCRVGFAFIPVLCTQEEYSAHSNFSELFIEAVYDSSRRILFFRRRGGAFPVCGVALADSRRELEFAVNREQLDAHSLKNLSEVFPLTGAHSAAGACITPLCAVVTPEIRGGSAIFLVSCASSYEECAEQLTRARRRQFKPNQSKPSYEANRLLTDCLFKKPAVGLYKNTSDCLWRFSLSGSVPLTVLEVFDESPVVSRLLHAYGRLKKAFITTELLFLVHEREKYMSPLRSFVEEAIGSEYSPFLWRAGGIAIADADSLDAAELGFLRAFAASFTESDTWREERARVPVFLPPPIERKKFGDGKVEYTTDGTVRDGSLRHYLPYSYVMAGHACGTVVTHKTLGFVYWRNARECRVTPFDGNVHADWYGLRIICGDGGKFYDLAAYADEVIYSCGTAVYSGSVEGHAYSLTVYARSLLPAVDYVLEFADGYSPLCAVIKKQQSDMTSEAVGGVWIFESLCHSAVRFAGFMRCSRKCELIRDTAMLFCGTDAGRNDILALRCRASSVKFTLGGAPSAEAAQRAASLCTDGNFAAEAREAAMSFMPGFVLNSGNHGLDSLFSSFAPYQTAISRFLGKTGFYQTGGAFGFRDQLQDCFCLVYSRPDVVRTHILRCAAHQYREGDVMHWWFTSPKGDTGIRTKCSDDFLFLPWVVADYIEKTGDGGILDVELPYRTSPMLEPNEVERYETPAVSRERESLYMHCIRALANGERRGPHGLSLMGSCDWNDGLSRVGVGGRGESVFTSWLFILVCNTFTPVMKLQNDVRSIEHFASASASLLLALERFAFEGGKYIRAVDDNGIFLGGENSPECRTDILSQAFAAIVLGKTERTHSAMSMAAERLFDKKSRLFKLFDPPFDKYNAGYISSYCPGLRENGGQYTHGALWGVIGLLRCGESEKALEILNAIMPYSHTDEDVFRTEPYVITADIYAGLHSGRGGWSWYTGSASWFFVTVLEEILGVRLSEGFSVIDVKPLTDYTLRLKLPCGSVEVAVSTLFAATAVDGKEAELPVRLTEGSHRIEVKRLIAPKQRDKNFKKP